MQYSHLEAAVLYYVATPRQYVKLLLHLGSDNFLRRPRFGACRVTRDGTVLENHMYSGLIQDCSRAESSARRKTMSSRLAWNLYKAVRKRLLLVIQGPPACIARRSRARACTTGRNPMRHRLSGHGSWPKLLSPKWECLYQDPCCTLSTNVGTRMTAIEGSSPRVHCFASEAGAGAAGRRRSRLSHRQ